MESITAFLTWLDTFINYEKLANPHDFSLDAITTMALASGNPQNDYRSIHIAGSKGKGSVAAMMSSVLSEMRFKTGLYTSPHITDFCERITQNNDFFTDDIYGISAKEVKETVCTLLQKHAVSPTWFELVTLFAYHVFKNAHCDWAVFETGMGGRLDATNIIQPNAVIITPIELEHTEWLGDTIAKIAAEKAGIITTSAPVFCQKQKPEALAVIRAKAAQEHAPFYYLPDYVENSTICMDNFLEHSAMDAVVTWKNEQSNFKCSLKMPGSVQGDNAALVALCVKTLFPNIQDNVIANGLSKAKLPGRFEITKLAGTTIVLDGAHTVESIRNTISVFTTLYPHGNAQLLFACAADKQVNDIAHLLAGHFSSIMLTRPGTVKASDIVKEENAFAGLLHTENLFIESDCSVAFEKALSDAQRDCVPLLVCGSFYLVAEVKRLLILIANNKHT